MLLSSENIREIETSLKRLEGVSVGLSPFYSRVTWYMDQQISAIYRILTEAEVPLQKLDGASKPGFEQIDREALEDDDTLSPHDPFPKKTLKRKVRDRKIKENLE